MAHGEIHPDEEDPNVLTFDKNPNSPSVSGNDSLGPASVWFPDYDRRHAGTIAPTGLAAGQQVSNLGDPFGNRIFNNLSQSQAISEWDDSTGYLTLALKEDLDKMAKEMGTSSSTGKGLWTRAVTNSFNASKKGRRVSPFESIQAIYSDYSKKLEEDGGKKKKYTGPTSSVTLANESDLRETANAVASAVLGRGIEDDEFQEVLKKIRKQEVAQPSISTPSTGYNVTQGGLSADGRKNIIRDSLMKGPEAEDYGKATKMMGVFAKALEMRSDGR
jgi:hypothetical protein